MSRYFLICLSIITSLVCSCIKVSSQTSNYLKDSVAIYTVGDTKGFNDEEFSFILKSMELLRLDTKDVSSRLNKPMSKQEILDLFRNTAKNISDSTTLYWFHISHGGSVWEAVGQGSSEYGIVAADTDEMDEKTYLMIDEIMKAIQEVRSTPFKRIVAFLSMCYAGKAMNNIKNYKSKVFQESLIYTFGSEQKAAAASDSPSMYSALYFLDLARQKPDASVEDLVKSTNDSVNQFGSFYVRFSSQDTKNCPGVRFASQAMNFAIIKSPIKQVDCEYKKEPVTISSRTNPTYEDLQKLISYLVLNPDTELKESVFERMDPYLYSNPSNVKQEQIWKK